MIEVILGKSGSGRQGSPHPHDAVLDPTGSFAIFPDLGSDHVRIFYISPETGELVEKEPVDVPRGSGPRHAAFHCPDAEVACWMYLASEIGNKVTAFQASYPAEDEMRLKEIQMTTSFGGKDPPRGTFGAAEVEISVGRSFFRRWKWKKLNGGQPDGRFVTVSNRQDQSFPNSDSLATWKILGNGTLEFVELAAAGGSGPRQFSFNKDGTMVAVGLQNDGEVAIFSRDVETGEIGAEIARIGGIASVAVVIWDE
jgi:6-phosphogluconolactonase (cycloisomerase 2 family)